MVNTPRKGPEPPDRGWAGHTASPPVRPAELSPLSHAERKFFVYLPIRERLPTRQKDRNGGAESCFRRPFDPDIRRSAGLPPDSEALPTMNRRP